MKSYFAKQNHQVISGGFYQCLSWARERIQEHENPVLILVTRAGEKNAKIVAEIDSDGERRVIGGKIMPISRLMRNSGGNG